MKYLTLLLALVATMATAQINVGGHGTIHPTQYKAGQTASVSIDRMPATLAEFTNLQDQVAKTPEGAVMMVLVAMEMYNRDRALGKQCVEMANVSGNYYSIINRLPDVFIPEEQGGRPYQVAAFFDGAKPENGYNPKSPYTINVRTSKVRSYEKVQSLKGYVLYLEVFSEGFDTNWRGVEVIKQKGSSVYKVNNCPSLYTRCKELDFESPREYEGLK